MLNSKIHFALFCRSVTKLASTDWDNNFASNYFFSTSTDRSFWWAGEGGGDGNVVTSATCFPLSKLLTQSICFINDSWIALRALFKYALETNSKKTLTPSWNSRWSTRASSWAIKWIRCYWKVNSYKD